MLVSSGEVPLPSSGNTACITPHLIEEADFASQQANMNVQTGTKDGGTLSSCILRRKVCISLVAPHFPHARRR